jgi:RecB family endonuclease NucS
MREPVNWQPAGTKSRFKMTNKQLTMYSNHTRPNEKMKTTFKTISSIQITKLHDPAKLLISGMESDVVNDIMCNPNLIEEGLRICQREKHVKSGMIDLFGYDKEHIPVIIEVKRSQATISAVHQLRMYVHDIKGESEKAQVRGILCAPKIPDMVKHLLSDYNLEWNEVERKIVLPDDNQTTLESFNPTKKE